MMPNLKEVTTQFFTRPDPAYTAPPLPQNPQNPIQATVRPQYPPAPKLQKQSKPTEITMSDFKYNAFNIDQLKLNITSRTGFDGVKPDMMIWNYYQYNVSDLQVNADETELSNYLNWSLQEKGIQDAKVDFHPNGKVSLSGKYPLLGIPLPFTAEVSLTVTPLNQILMTIDDFKTGFSVPSKLRDTLLGLFIEDHGNTSPAGPPPLSPLDAFSFADAMKRVGPNQIMLDFGKMKVPMNLPIAKLVTTEQGVQLSGGSETLKTKP
ncbi:hypothetical protein COW36_00720 [bacterium (Candidatus Blackallbacteria) CG17_big_fil_post_rev_8_21_14_2_50_48_46]|uniref:Uncharacterized protein n=1 Tax=bacterium (Candidatus Blackallbacteria) CG17_big_fil_post_rev_8_21_14_2_50_48_46 TaxID=2014261 RepID=A0A2M7GBT0_9BACT|nr:MAG: hypothetical protein COW64_10455 [bacterium (Candidatus Blackallbacteria) CG18_big_fil_WC_8_21_14_2_50_49_26]PIW19393.1 MAG: hypothetical protein COW36_00720 [bacterium (Candidatus Blackallbacteria) CG17_big_fil_post_rev_8_21_14_2_50_48_46]PIW49003.1 MAG: hypothetical protein COW20_07735 [bacterium (Candidatus Blackallbacteria) CG13_big_fil_rev_8_21_14_2_50_49_14]